MSHHGSDPIAIIGMACRLPGDSNSISSLWNLLERGGCAATGAPESRFNLKGHFDGSRKRNTLKSPGAMFLENVDLAQFDAPIFSISTKEAIAMDPQQRQLLEVVYECLENAGVTLSDVSGAPMGCFVASSTSDYRDVHARDPEDRPANATVGLVPAILSNRISHFLNIKGPSMTIDTACSASMVSLDVANKYMRSGDINAAIVAGVHLWLSPEANMDSGAMREAFSSSGRCHVFDANADGYIKAEGVNAILLKRLSDAVRDGDPIRAVLRGSATNSDGRTPGIANPSAKAQAAAIEAAYANAAITDLSATAYLECHGTGTLAGDPVEVEAASNALCKMRGEEPLLIGSIKSNIGHSECSAGVSGVIKAVLALEKGLIPGTPTFVIPNPKIDFQGLRVRASRASLPWPKVPLRRASVNSFGFGGSNAHAVIEESKPWADSTYVSSSTSLDEFEDFFTEEDTSSDTPSILVFSANDKTSLSSYVGRLRKHLLQPSVRVELRDLAFTLSERRTHHFYRGFITTNKASFDPKTLVSDRQDAEAPRIGFVFTGQGAQWPQMGKLLIEQFPLAKQVIQRMDDALRKSLSPPFWSLINELTEIRTADTLRQPFLSQPLVTALQIAIVEVLRSWGIRPQAVIGHSSGEIAAAYCAGHLAMGDAIKAAFYRGQASFEAQKSAETHQGMLAVGVGSQQISSYLSGYDPPVEIACYNSPKSLTLSGNVGALSELKARLEADGHFARMLHVDLAYHSRYMTGISGAYRRLLDQDFRPEPFCVGQTLMFSSVLGHELDRATDAEYWQKNMASPVLFEQALRSMSTGQDGANFLIEIGPSGTLAGPVSDLKILHNLQYQYCASFKRSQDTLKLLFEVAGRLFISGAKVNMQKVNERDHIKPRVIVDLPNYSWNHSTRYWHESEASKDWRFRMFPPHDLIGSKVLGTSWHAPIWKKDLDLDEIPWLKDHQLGSDIVVPGAALVVMAVEALSQMSIALHDLESKKLPVHPSYRVRNATFSRALVLEEGRRQPIMIVLTPRSGSRDSWYDFKISSLISNQWIENSRGIIRVEEDRRIMADKKVLSPLVNSMPGALWYQSMEEVGYALGPAFQKHLEAESLSGTRDSRSTISLKDPASPSVHSNYHIHPTSLDAILQACAPALWNGNRTNINAVIIPAIIDDMVISSQPDSTTMGMATFSSSYTGIGDPHEVKNYTADAQVYDAESGLCLFQLSKLRTSTLNTQAVSYTDPVFCGLTWKPDVTFLSSKQLARPETPEVPVRDTEITVINELIELIAFKKQNLKVVEAVTIPHDSSSLWLEAITSTPDVETVTESFQLAHADAKTLLEVQEKYETQANAAFNLIDFSKPSLEKNSSPDELDVAIARTETSSTETLRNTIQNSTKLLCEGGYFILILYKDAETNVKVISTVIEQTSRSLVQNGFRDVNTISIPASSNIHSAFLATKKTTPTAVLDAHTVHLLSFLDISEAGERVIGGLEQLGWIVEREDYPFESGGYKGTILILDDLSSPLLSSVKQWQWATLQKLITSHNKILWVTEGSQFEVTKPGNAQIHGLMRTIRDEDPGINLTTLDVEHSAGEHTVPTCHKILEYLSTSTFQKTGDYEFVERDGRIYVGRVLQDGAMNRFAKAEQEGADSVTRTLHDADAPIRMSCEQVGNLDSLKFHELGPDETMLRDDQVEIEIAAAGLNFKDIAISTGLIPGNEGLLGFEGAGTIRRSKSDLYSSGQRVLFTKPGSFATRIIVEIELVQPIPDSMTFEQAATLGAVYPTAMYSLFDLANIQRGQRVLIHSAAGGLGIACMNLCQHIGAEVFATVGNDDKRKFLVETMGISSSNIFNSRSIRFGAELLAATNGEGVDVIINSLTGDLLEESWNCIRDGGTMVELGKRDILERNYLPMEQFARNVSYRAFDISHRSVSSKIMSRLLQDMFALLHEGHIKPISPCTVFPFDNITGAFRHMRDGKHMGKIVVSRGSQADVKVPVRPLLQTMRLRDDLAYLIVGGLKGLCGSIALFFARHGAKHLIVMGRSGFDDRASQTVTRNIEAENCKIHLVQGDVIIKKDVERAFAISGVPIGGILQGAMAVRGKLYQAMTAADYHYGTACKVTGTWNLHNLSLSQQQQQPLDFFTLLSSTSGIAGQSGQANYVAANAFLDAFALHRRRLDLRANSIALGPMWDVGYMSRNRSSLPKTNASTFVTISERLLHRIVGYSVMQQSDDPINPATSPHLITGMAIPLHAASTLRTDARFSPLFGTPSPHPSLHSSSSSPSQSKEAQIFHLLHSTCAPHGEQLTALTALLNARLASILQLKGPMEPSRSPGSYGMESLAAVEVRNWVRMELKADVTMLEVLNAESLVGLGERVLGKMQAGADAAAARGKS
ncbi:MAG: Type I Iterative PKS [Chrysothrix sp. TS-e1954]|nr:MAG: Type I Iterative PKS [Chrysothrix sp. TS-e1954]